MGKKGLISILVASLMGIVNVAKAEDSILFKLEGRGSLGTTRDEAYSVLHNYDAFFLLREDFKITDKIKSKISFLGNNSLKNNESGLLSTSNQLDYRDDLRIQTLDVDFKNSDHTLKNTFYSMGIDLFYSLNSDESIGLGITYNKASMSNLKSEDLDSSSTKRISMLNPENLEEYIETAVIQVNEGEEKSQSLKSAAINYFPSLSYKNASYNMELIYETHATSDRNLQNNSLSGREITSERNNEILVRDFSSHSRNFNEGFQGSNNLHFLINLDTKKYKKIKLGVIGLVNQDMDFATRCLVEDINNDGMQAFAQYSHNRDSIYIGMLERRTDNTYPFLRSRELVDPRIPESQRDFLAETSFVNLFKNYKGFYIAGEYFVNEGMKYDIGYCGKDAALISSLDSRPGRNNSLYFLFSKSLGLKITLGNGVGLGIIGKIDR